MHNFDLAPAPVDLGPAGWAVPIDIQHIAAAIELDAVTSRATGDATLEFVMGPMTGRPLFDLVPEPTEVWVDGVAADVRLVSGRRMGTPVGPVDDTTMRLGPTELAAGSTHTLRIRYPLRPIENVADSLSFGADGVRLRVAMRDQRPRRYLERWVPANLLFDQFSMQLALRILGSAVEHRVLTNGEVMQPTRNEWAIAFPERFTACSHFLEVHPAAALETATAAAMLGSGATVSVEVHKARGDHRSAASEAANVVRWLSEIDATYGPYMHGPRFTAVLRSAGFMEYEGATTSEAGAPVLLHEAFHSWFGRGVKPASQADGWWDEAIADWFHAGARATRSLDLTRAPVALAPAAPFTRVTDSRAYVEGEQLIEGLAGLVGPAALKELLRRFYLRHRARPARTVDLEGTLLAESGRAEVVDAFHRLAYGLGPTTSGVRLKPDLRADPEHPFWDSPNVWIGGAPQGVVAHEAPVAGTDNWFYARVMNSPEAGVARHYMVTFAVRHFPGVEFTYPQDFLPAVAATGGFDLLPGEERVLSARWPAELVPPAGDHVCVLASVHAWQDHPEQRRNVWEEVHLAQRNVTIVAASSGEFALVRFEVAGADDRKLDRFVLELIGAWPDIEGCLLEPRLPRSKPVDPDLAWLGERQQVDELTTAIERPIGAKEPVRMQLRRGVRRSLAVRIRVPDSASPGDVLRLHVVKRRLNGTITGGVTLEIHVTKEPT